MDMTVSALVRDLKELNERLQVPLPARVERQVRALIQQAIGILPDAPERTSSHTLRVPLSDERLARYAPHPETLGPDEAASAYADALQQGQHLASSAYASVGPVLSPAQVAQRVGVTRATVHNWRQAGRLLALRPNQHTYVFPAIQFDDSTEDGLLIGLVAVLRALADVSELGKALWLGSANPGLDGQSPADVLRKDKGRALSRVLASAEAAYSQGS
jgi:hypothetical protein